MPANQENGAPAAENLKSELRKFLHNSRIVIIDDDDHGAYRWCSMMECKLEESIMQGLLDLIVDVWLGQNVTAMSQLQTVQGMTPEAVVDLVRGLVETYLSELMGVE